MNLSYKEKIKLDKTQGVVPILHPEEKCILFLEKS